MSDAFDIDALLEAEREVEAMKKAEYMERMKLKKLQGQMMAANRPDLNINTNI